MDLTEPAAAGDTEPIKYRPSDGITDL